MESNAIGLEVGRGRYGCERCKSPAPFLSLDYCATCSRNLCPKCATKGCCGASPMKSGLERDRHEKEG